MHTAPIGGLAHCVFRRHRRASARPTIGKTWRAKWTDIITLFDFPAPIRKAIYNEESALKIVYMAIHEAAKKWTMPIRHSKQALNHFAITFEGRLTESISK
ncbi:MAG: hypothetical protein ACYC4U_13750 [Pirellulaceae bacterium]